MSRTKKRALVQGLISPRNALAYATLLSLVGFIVLLRYTNVLTASIGLIGFIDYVILYGLAKRRSTYSTIIGSISGATPIVAGYTAVTNHFDIGAFLLFIILVCWQMPHFYAIALYRLDDYAAAHLPVLPVQKGLAITKIHIILYIIAFNIACISLTALHYTGYSYLIIITIFNTIWIWFAITGFFNSQTKRWARKMFFFSLVIILAFSLLLSINVAIP